MGNGLNLTGANRRKLTAMILLHVRKTFDNVTYILVKKLQDIGISRYALELFNPLSKRKMSGCAKSFDSDQRSELMTHRVFHKTVQIIA